ncbi:thioredoxin domain-containing protein [bacterium]|nr:thioredoxin domain-containing protein [bacterium]
MKKALLLLTLLVTLCGLLVSCNTSPTVATVGNKAIYDAELEKKAENQLSKLRLQIYNTKRTVLDQLIEEKLLQIAAEEAHKTVPQFLQEEVNAKIVPPTEDEIKAFYKEKRGSSKKSYNELKPQVNSYLTQSKIRKEKSDLISKLKEKYQIDVKMETPRKKINISGDPFLGPKDAPITLIEFADFECPFCQKIQPTIVKLMETYKDKVKLVFKNFPLNFHKNARKAHLAAACVNEQDKFWEYKHMLFENQKNLKESNLKEYAKNLKIDMKKFSDCFTKEKYSDDIDRDVNAGKDIGVTGTPAFFINGIMISGTRPYEAFVEIIEQELGK